MLFSGRFIRQMLTLTNSQTIENGLFSVFGSTFFSITILKTMLKRSFRREWASECLKVLQNNYHKRW